MTNPIPLMVVIEQDGGYIVYRTQPPDRTAVAERSFSPEGIVIDKCPPPTPPTGGTLQVHIIGESPEPW